MFSNIVTTVSPSYAQEVRTAEVWMFSCGCPLQKFLLNASIIASTMYHIFFRRDSLEDSSNELYDNELTTYVYVLYRQGQSASGVKL